MAKSTQKQKKSKKKIPDQVNRRLQPTVTTPTAILALLGGGGSLLVGAGLFAQFGNSGEALYHDKALWILAGGAFLISGALWFAAAADAVLRVGDGGVVLEKSNEERLAWYEMTSITWSEVSETLLVKGRRGGASVELTVRAKGHPQGVPWIIREARARVPAIVDLPEGIDGKLDTPQEDAGMITKEPRQIVGAKCSKSSRAIMLESDAVVCVQCGRTYHREEVPEECECGAKLVAA
jgi:hypothetical protein